MHHLVETGWWNLWWKPFAAEGEIVERRAAVCLVLGEQQAKASAAGERVGSEIFPFAHWDLHHIFAFGPIIVQRKLCGTEVRVGWGERGQETQHGGQRLQQMTVDDAWQLNIGERKRRKKCAVNHVLQTLPLRTITE